ncbi:MAG: TolC family protein [Bacillota bacterium]
MRLPRALVATLVSVSVFMNPVRLAVAEEVVTPPEQLSEGAPASQTRLLSLDQALTLAEANNPGLQLAAYQLAGARDSLTTAPANAQALAPAASAFMQVQYGVAVPQEAISPEVAAQQARISYEQAAAQYYSARQQVRAGALQAYVEWQRAVATIDAQQAALDRALTQEANVEAALEVGTAAQYDLLQVQAAVAGQQAALIGAQAMEAGARNALGQVIGIPLAGGLRPEPNQIRAAEVALPTDLEALVSKAMANRPDLRRNTLDLASRRLQTSLSGSGSLVQLQASATQYQLSAAKARAEVSQALLAAHGALEELKAREKALEPAREALRLAELRYEAGIATYLEVQGASAAALQAEAARIQAAANLTLRMLQLRQAIGEL